MRYYLTLFAIRLLCILVAAIGSGLVASLFGVGDALFTHDGAGAIIGSAIAGAAYGGVLAVIACVLTNPVKDTQSTANWVQLLAGIFTLGVTVGDFWHNQLGIIDLTILVALYVIPIGGTLAVSALGRFWLPRLFPSLPQKPARP